MDHEITVVGDDMKVVDADGNTIHLSVEELKKPEYERMVTGTFVFVEQDEPERAQEVVNAAKLAAEQYLIDHSL